LNTLLNHRKQTAKMVQNCGKKEVLLSTPFQVNFTYYFFLNL